MPQVHKGPREPQGLKVSLAQRDLLARKVTQDFKELPAPLVRRGHKVFKVCKGSKGRKALKV